MLQLLEHPAADGVIIAFKGAVFLVQLFHQVVHIIIAADLVCFFVLFDKLFLKFVVLIPDFSDQFLHQIFDGNQSQGAAVIIGHDCQRHLFFAQLFQQSSQPHGFMNKQARGQQISDVLLCPCDLCFQNIPNMDYPDDVVDGAFVDRDAGNLTLFCKLDRFLPAVLHIQSDHIHTWGDDFLRLDFVKLQRRTHKVALGLLQHAFFLDGFYQIFQFFLGDRWFFLLAAGQLGHDAGQKIEHSRKRFKDDH